MSELAEEMLLHRVAGATYEAISMLYEVPIHKVRSVCRLAVKRGAVTREQVNMKTVKQPLRIPEELYNESWMRRTLSRVKQDENGCWIWQGLVNNGYGSTTYRGKTKILHRQMYKVFHNVSLRTDQYVCHSCDVKLCCNPAHLWIGSNSDNVKDSARKGRHAEVKVTHCPRNHPYDAVNTYVTPRGLRNCKACARARQRIKAGWPEELAYSVERVPPGYTREVIA